MPVDLAAIAGTPHNIYATDDDARKVFDIFRKGYIEFFNVDPMQQRTMFTAPVMRSVQQFVRDYGAEDAARITRFVFSKWKGRNRRNPVGKEMFSKRFRWLTDLALTELKADEGKENLWM